MKELNMLSKVACIVLCIFLAICGRGQTEEVANCNTATLQLTGVQGLPGQTGPVGVPGVPGPPGPMGLQGPLGPSGTCSCDFENVTELQKQVHDLRDQVAIFNSLLHDDVKVASCSVGMKDGRIQDSQLTASSQYDNNHIAAHGRLDNTPSSGDAGVWVPQPSRRNRPGEWIQIDLLEPTRVVGVVTQGRSKFHRWVTSYKIQYGNSVSTLKTIKDENGNDKVFQGNTDRNTYVIRAFPRPLVARYFRLVAQTFHGFIELRMDYVTC